ncbi:MAG: AAA family ATPase [Pseudomonadota bacterium]|nr:AAA family ATPase [Pseudomonadota bacterium]
MYTQFFGLNEKPFSITPDPRYLYLSKKHTDALAHLVYGVSESGGFIQLTGEVGTGKTTLVRSLIEQIPEEVDIALILNPQLTTKDFLVTICEELDIEIPDNNTIKILIDNLSKYLLDSHAKGRRTVLIVDEAQNLNRNVLEQVRLLTNLETSRQKLLQIIFIGQPELRETINKKNMRQLSQRITGRYHLDPLSKKDALQYIKHRMRIAGAMGEIFKYSSLKEIYRLSQGIPRIINVLCDHALLAAYTEEIRVINKSIVRKSAKEIYGNDKNTHSPNIAFFFLLLGSAFIIFGISKILDPNNTWILEKLSFFNFF